MSAREADFDSRARTWDEDVAKRQRADLDREDGSFHGTGFTGHNGFERADLGARLERSGFRDVRFETVFEVKKITASGPKAFPVFLAIGEKSSIQR